MVDGVVAADDNGEGGGDADVLGYAGGFGSDVNSMTPFGNLTRRVRERNSLEPLVASVAGFHDWFVEGGFEAPPFPSKGEWFS